MAKSSGGKKGTGMRYENPPPKTSAKVKKEMGKALREGSTERERSLAGSVGRHIEPRKSEVRTSAPPPKPGGR
jgi:hypothetical protein